MAMGSVFGLTLHAASSPERWTGVWSIDGLEINSDWGRIFTADNWKPSIQIQHTGGANYKVGAVGSSASFAVTESGNDLVSTGSEVDPENPDTKVDQSFRFHWVADDWAVFIQSSIGRDVQTQMDTHFSSFNVGVMTRTPATEPLRPWEGTYSGSELNIESGDAKAGISTYISHPTVTLVKTDAQHYRPSVILNDMNPAYDELSVQGNYLGGDVTTQTDSMTVRRFHRCYQLPGWRICTITAETFFAPQFGQPVSYTGCYVTLAQLVPESRFEIARQGDTFSLSVLQGVPGLNYSLQYSAAIDSLAPWTTMTNLVLNDASYLFPDTLPNNSPTRFYRLAIEVPATTPFQ